MNSTRSAGPTWKVALTQSIQSLFGAKAANPEYGFLYNNYLLTCPRRKHTHRLGPGSPARSNAAPTLVLGERGSPAVLALGAAGSRRIISSLVQVISGAAAITASAAHASRYRESGRTRRLRIAA